MQQQPVPLIGAKRAGFRYNRRDIQFDERFEAVNSSDARVLILAKLARPAPPETSGRASTAAAGGIVMRDAGIPTTPRAMAEKLDRELAPDAPPIPEGALVVLQTQREAFDTPPELGGKPKKKRVRKPKAQAPESAPNP